MFLLNSGNSFTSITLLGEDVHYGGNLVFNIAGYTPRAEDVFTVFNMTGGATASGNFSSVEVGGTFLSYAGGIWSGTDPLGVRYQFSDATGQLTVRIVPEPSRVSTPIVTGNSRHKGPIARFAPCRANTKPEARGFSGRRALGRVQGGRGLVGVCYPRDKVQSEVESDQNSPSGQRAMPRTASTAPPQFSIG